MNIMAEEIVKEKVNVTLDLRIDGAKVKKIKDALKNNPRGLTIAEISEATGLGRITVKKYLLYLLSKKEVEMRQVGVAKVFYLKG
jgi:response regulator of citrate/malate metabolism